jgi:hypothetical protein
MPTVGIQELCRSCLETMVAGADSLIRTSTVGPLALFTKQFVRGKVFFGARGAKEKMKHVAAYMLCVLGGNARWRL